MLTNAHVVDNASLLRVSRHGESKKHPARLVCIAHDIDLALLEVQGGLDQVVVTFCVLQGLAVGRFGV